MGASIAQTFAQFNYHTVLYAPREASFQRARKIIVDCQDIAIKNGIVTTKESEKIQNSIIYTMDSNCFKNADLVIESIPEVLESKIEFLQMLSEVLPAESIVTTNTSAISINELGKHITHSERFCGTHWLNPPHIIPLVEVVRSKTTSNAIIDTLLAVLKSVNKEPVVLKKDIKGFISNRLQFALLREASYLVENGVATPEDIDRTLKYGNGIRYSCSGPFKIVDLGGIEVFNNVAKYLYPDLCNSNEKNSLLEDMIAKKCYGVKSGQGFYHYTETEALEEINERDRKMLEVLKIY
ncbi:MAG: hbd1 [Firmicutes bacterium]|nr:hbd1 [Bacillota bacterium]